MHELYSVFTLLILLSVYGIVFYFFITAIRFMKQKNNHDKELLQKINELIKLSKGK